MDHEKLLTRAFDAIREVEEILNLLNEGFDGVATTYHGILDGGEPWDCDEYTPRRCRLNYLRAVYLLEEAFKRLPPTTGFEN
jgi:hypothetical protein